MPPGATGGVSTPSFTSGSPEPSQTASKPVLETLAGRETLLVVDDEPIVRNTTALLLRRLGYNVLTACNGVDATDIAEKHKGEIHLVVLDIVMPVMDGPETFSVLHSKYPDMKVVLFSGYDLDESSKRLLAEGANGFVRKPARASELAQKIREALDS